MRPTASAKPTVPSKHIQRYLAKDEVVELQMQQHWARVLPAIAACIIGFILVIAAGLAAPAWMGYATNAAWWVWLILLGHLIWRIIEWKDEKFVVTNRRLLLVYGIFVKKVAMMPLSKVTDMEYKRTLAGRLLGYGTFVLESAGQAQALDVIDYVRFPDQRYREISGLMFGTSPHDDGDNDAGTDAGNVPDADDPPIEEFDDFDAETNHHPRQRRTVRADDAAMRFPDSYSEEYEPWNDGEGDADDTFVLAPSRAPSRTRSHSQSRANAPHLRERTTDPSDITDPDGRFLSQALSSEDQFRQTRDCDSHHTYTGASVTASAAFDGTSEADDPADLDGDSAWSVSREHATRPQTVRRSHHLDDHSNW